jgi:hypothetical protein
MRNYLIALAYFCLLTLTSPVSAGLLLVTPAEAVLPAGDVPAMRGITRGPSIELASPNPGIKSVKSPFDFKVRFLPHSGSTIDLSSVQVLYVKTPTVNLTQRMATYISDKGISVTGAQVPPGEHTVVVSVADSSGRRGTSVMVINVVE